MLAEAGARFIRCLNAAEKTVPVTKAMHIVLDHYAARKHPKVIAWLARHPRIALAFAGAGSSPSPRRAPPGSAPSRASSQP